LLVWLSPMDRAITWSVYLNLPQYGEAIPSSLFESAIKGQSNSVNESTYYFGLPPELIIFNGYPWLLKVVEFLVTISWEKFVTMCTCKVLHEFPGVEFCWVFRTTISSKFLFNYVVYASCEILEHSWALCSRRF